MCATTQTRTNRPHYRVPANPAADPNWPVSAKANCRTNQEGSETLRFSRRLKQISPANANPAKPSVLDWSGTVDGVAQAILPAPRKSTAKERICFNSFIGFISEFYASHADRLRNPAVQAPNTIRAPARSSKVLAASGTGSATQFPVGSLPR